MINALDKKQHLTLIIILICIFSLWKTILPFCETLDSSKGYSIIWFIVLYIIGAYISKYDFNIFKRNWLNLICYAGIVLGIAVFKLVCIVLSKEMSIAAAGQGLLYNYDSITVLFASIFLLLFFKNIKANKPRLTKTIDFIVPSVFSI